MSEALERHLFGDSNIVRYLPKLQEAKSDPSIKAVSMTKSTNSVLLRDALSSPTSAYPIIIIAALTNLITAKFFEDYDLLVEHCKTVFTDVLLWVQEGRDSLDGFATLVSYQHYQPQDITWLPNVFVKYHRVFIVVSYFRLRLRLPFRFRVLIPAQGVTSCNIIL
jgi:hypothetical protein